jgi:hypothetical protein
MAAETSCNDPTNFRVQAKRFMLTYKSHIDKSKLTTWLDDKWPMSFIRCAHETGDDEHPYLHTHVLCEVASKTIDVKNCRAFDFDDVHPHVKKIRTKTHWAHARVYIAKEDLANADLAKEKPSIAQAIWDAPSLEEAFKTCVSRPGDACGVLILWGHRPRDKSTKQDMPLRPWQKQVVDLIDAPVDDRAIYWIYDPDGCGGKSVLSDWLHDWRGAYVVTQLGNEYHAASVLQSACDSGWDGKLFVVDFPRQAKDVDFYGVLECVKNGRITALKNRGKTVSWPKGNVLSLANFAPKPGMWTPDRYRVQQLNHGNLVQLNYDPRSGELRPVSPIRGAAPSSASSK